MAEPTQFTFSWTEVAELLIKRQNIHEGKWMIGVEYSVSVGVMGVAAPNAMPGAMVLAASLQLIKAQEASPKNLVVDAAEINPPPMKRRRI